jgi:hypothetical protein
MRIFVVLICSLALALVNANAQEPQGKKEKKKAAPTGQAAPHPGKPATGKPMQAGKTGGVPGKPPEAGKAKATGQPTQVRKPTEVGRTKEPSKPTVKPAEVGKAKGAAKPGETGVATQAGKRAGGPKQKPGGKAGAAGVAANKPVKPVKPQHFNVPKQPNTAKAPPVKFQQGKHIKGSQNWQGASYTVFRNYTPVWHDQGWWHSHYNNIVFVFGAPYFFNAGYWFPAWGYQPNAYYAWDGPIYAYNNLPPDQVIANVQSALQQQGYYQGEVDGLIGPQTRGALAAYQRDRGLTETAAIDQPTLQSLGMA